MRRRSVVALGAAGLAGLPSWAQTKFPSRPLTLVVPTGAGSGGDAWARAFSAGWQEELGQPVVVDNRAGGGGMIAIDAVVRAQPDGHTLLVGNPSLVTNQLAFKTVSYDAFADLAPIGRIGTAPIVFVADPSLGIQTLQQFVQAAKGKNFNYGSFSVGSTQHLFAMLLSQAHGLDMTHVVYKGEAPAMPDLLTGRIQCGFFTATTVKSLVQAGKLKALAVLTPTRLPGMPEVPTMLEAGMDRRFSWQGWIAVFAPAKTPADVQARLSLTMDAALRRPEVRRKLEEQDMVVGWAPPAELLAMERESLEAMRTLRNMAGLKPE